MLEQARIWPLVEITEHGQKWELRVPEKKLPGEESLKNQGRFRNVDNPLSIQQEVDARWNKILLRSKLSA